MSIAITDAVGEALADALSTAIGSGAILEIRTGAAPGPDNAATGTLLVSITLTGSFTSTNPLIGANPGEVLPTAGGVAGHFRLKSSGGTALIEGSITTVGGGGDLQMASTTVTMGIPVDLGAPAFAVPLS